MGAPVPAAPCRVRVIGHTQVASLACVATSAVIGRIWGGASIRQRGGVGRAAITGLPTTWHVGLVRSDSVPSQIALVALSFE